MDSPVNRREPVSWTSFSASSERTGQFFGAASFHDRGNAIVAGGCADEECLQNREDEHDGLEILRSTGLKQVRQFPAGLGMEAQLPRQKGRIVTGTTT
jgi:hypothetical protein